MYVYLPVGQHLLKYPFVGPILQVICKGPSRIPFELSKVAMSMQPSSNTLDWPCAEIEMIFSTF